MLSKRIGSVAASALFLLSALAVGITATAEKTLTPAMTIVMDGEQDSVKGWTNEKASWELEAGVSPLGKAVKITNPSEKENYPEYLLNATKIAADQKDAVQGLAFWVKAPEKVINFGMDMRYGKGSLVQNQKYTLIDEKGGKTEQTLASNIEIPANFTGWVIMPKACFGEAFDPSTYDAFGFNYDPAYFLGTTFYLDSFGFYTDFDAMVASVTPEEPVKPVTITEITEENKEMVVLNDGSSAATGVGIQWESGVAKLEVSDASPDGKALSITPPKDCSSFEVCPRLVMPENAEADIKAGKYTGFAFWYKAPTTTSGTAGISLFEEKQRSDGKWTRTCFGMNSTSTYYTIDKDNVFKEYSGGVAVPGFEGWIFIPFDSFVRGWGNNEELGDVDLEPWAMQQLDITFNPKGEGSDGQPSIYDDFSFYTTIEKVKTAFGAKDEQLPTPPDDPDDSDPSDDPDTSTDPSDDPSNKPSDDPSKDNPETGAGGLAPLALLLTAAAGMALYASRKRA